MPTLAIDIPTPEWALPLIASARYKGASGGRASGKSHFFAELAVESMACDPNLRVVCIREVQRSLEESVKFLVESKIRAMGVQSLFDVKAREIKRRNGKGLMIFEGMQDHTADSIKSLEGFGRAWVEEAQRLSARSMRLLLPTIRAAGSEIWFSWNPDQPEDPVDAFFAGKPEGAIHVHSTFRDNPFREEAVDKEAARSEQHDPLEYAHVYLGGYDLGSEGRVYTNFLAKPAPDGNLDGGIKDLGAELVVGMDFNINPMSAVVGVKAVDELHIINAIQLPISNTDEMAAELKRQYPGRSIIICPDPAGGQRRTSAAVVGETDFTILRRHGFTVDAARSHPLVPDRVNAVQQMLCDKTGRRRLLIRPDVRPLILSLAGLAYKVDTKSGPRHSNSRLPDKTKGLDHMADALGYLVWQRFNLLSNRRATTFEFRI